MYRRMAPTLIKVGKYRHRQKMALFDYDWTLVRPKSNGTFSKGLDDWRWMSSNVPQVMEEFYKKGFAICIVSNQTKNTDMKTEQIVNVLSLLPVPAIVAIAKEKEDKKPNRTMFDAIVGEKKVDFKKSVFIGDALGRKGDWSDVDKQFAINSGLINILAPDDLFKVEKEPQVAVKEIEHQEIILMVGFPGSGKSTIANSFNKDKYVVINGDELKTSKRMIKASEKFLDEGYSVIYDATNPSIEKRKEYIQVAEKYSLPIRAIVMTTDMTEAIFRNNKRDKVIPKIVYYTFRKKFEEPSLEEGFVDIVKV